MITIGEITVDLNDPVMQLVIAGGVVLVVVLVLLIMAVRRAGEASRQIGPGIGPEPAEPARARRG